jgi:flagellar protein FlaG
MSMTMGISGSSNSNFALPPAGTSNGLAVSRVEQDHHNSSAASADAIPVQDVQRLAGAQPSSAELRRITEELQHHVSVVTPELEFSVDESSGRSMVKVTDRTTHEVIRQFPSEEMLQIAKGIDRFQKGLLLNSKV